jgi:hypothetical protein
MKTFAFPGGKLFRVSLFFILAAGVLQVATVLAQKADAEESAIWQPMAEDNIYDRGQRYLHPEKYTTFRLNQPELNRVLEMAPLENSEESRALQVIITVPKPDGTIARFRLEESPVLSPQVAKEFPNWKTYQGYGVDDPAVTARFSWTDNGFHGYVLGGHLFD